MSAFVAVRYDDCIKLLTDGSAIDVKTGRLGAVVNKVWKSHSLPIAVTGRGSWIAVEDTAKMIISIADRYGSVDRSIFALRGTMDYRKSLPNRLLFDVLITAWSETEGPKLWTFGTHDQSPGFPPFELHDLGDTALGGPTLSPDAVAEFATVPLSDPQFFDKHGAEVLDWMRRQEAEINLYEPGDLRGYHIGGHCQLTTITEASATTVTLQQFDDEVGEPINPFSDDGSVVPLSHARQPLNRHQRRKMKAKTRRKAG